MSIFSTSGRNRQSMIFSVCLFVVSLFVRNPLFLSLSTHTHTQVFIIGTKSPGSLCRDRNCFRFFPIGNLVILLMMMMIWPFCKQKQKTFLIFFRRFRVHPEDRFGQLNQNHVTGNRI